MSFDSDMKKARKKIDDAINKSIRAASLELFGQIIKKTPVGNPSIWQSEAPRGYIGGSLRGNWQTQLGRPITRILDVRDGGGVTLGRTKSALANFDHKKTSDIWFTNNLPYAERVEKGWSTQRPEGMVRVTVKSFESVMDKIARRFQI